MHEVACVLAVRVERETVIAAREHAYAALLERAHCVDSALQLPLDGSAHLRISRATELRSALECRDRSPERGCHEYAVAMRLEHIQGLSVREIGVVDNAHAVTQAELDRLGAARVRRHAQLVLARYIAHRGDLVLG